MISAVRQVFVKRFFAVAVKVLGLQGGGHYKAGQLAPYKAGQVAPYKATHPLILGARVTPIRPLFKKFSCKISKFFLM